jgi:glycerol-3-phosphate dehydrogenase
VTQLVHNGNKVSGVRVTDTETGQLHDVHAKCVVNATGVWVDAIRRMDRSDARTMVAPSQGVHLVVDADFLPGKHALLVPKTADGRVLFAVPWMGKVILGTTDTPRSDLASEPNAFPEEVQFILNEAGNYLARKPQRQDVRSVWVGLRPLVKPPDEEGEETKGLSREHTVLIGRSGLVTVTGGKWTTYRSMAADVMDRCVDAGLVQQTGKTDTSALRLAGAPQSVSHTISEAPGIHLFGTDAPCVQALRGSNRQLAEGLTEAMVRFAVREEFARTVEDVLARRSRLLFLDAAKARKIARDVADIIRDELGDQFDADASAKQFDTLAAQYLLVDD